MDDDEFFRAVRLVLLCHAGKADRSEQKWVERLESGDFRRLAAESNHRRRESMKARLPSRPPIVFDVDHGLVSDLAGELQRLPKPKLKGWRAADLILRLGLDMDFSGCAALLADRVGRPENTLRNQLKTVAGLLKPINPRLAGAIDDGIKVARNGAITLDCRDIPAIMFRA